MQCAPHSIVGAAAERVEVVAEGVSEQDGVLWQNYQAGGKEWWTGMRWMG